MKYTETEAYQKEIAQQYKERNLEMVPSEVSNILSNLGFEVDESDIQQAEAGNMNATFITNRYVVKISDDPNSVAYSANRVVSEQLPDQKVVRVAAHDVREKTNHEVLVMERATGTVWLATMPTIGKEDNQKMFSQVLEVAVACRNIQVTDRFGWVTDILSDPEKNGFLTFRSQLEARLAAYVPKIKAMPDIDQEELEKILTYVNVRLGLFDDDKPSFVHSDLHMGNVMHKNGELTAVIDWDSAQSAPSYKALIPLIGLIDNPGQFVEGTPNYQAYKGKKFEYLYPQLREAFTEELKDPKLSEKLNVLGIIDGLMWVSEDWSREWSKEMIENLSTRETLTNGDISNTYYGETIGKLRAAQ